MGAAQSLPHGSQTAGDSCLPSVPCVPSVDTRFQQVLQLVLLYCIPLLVQGSERVCFHNVAVRSMASGLKGHRH